MTERIAIILLNTGGPDNKKAILPYFYNFYLDPQNMPLPTGLRNIAALFTAFVQRFITAKETYRRLAYQSPLLQNTKAQALSLERTLNSMEQEDIHYRCYVSMNYWHPFSDEVIDELKEYGPERAILLPMFAQKSYKTTFSEVKDWLITAKEEDFTVETSLIDQFFDLKGFIEAAASQITLSMYRISDKARRKKLPKPRIVFVARYHQPRFKKAGDPFSEQVEKSAEDIIKAIGNDYDYRVCYQLAPIFESTIGPTIDDVLIEAAQDNTPVLIFPISYSVENPITMVDMQQLYAERAEKYGVPLYERAITVGNHNDLMAALAEKIITKDGLIKLNGYDASLKDKIFRKNSDE
jgi:ferrochelatase